MPASRPESLFPFVFRGSEFDIPVALILSVSLLLISPVIVRILGQAGWVSTQGMLPINGVEIAVWIVMAISAGIPPWHEGPKTGLRCGGSCGHLVEHMVNNAWRMDIVADRPVIGNDAVTENR
jgi:hypothetical protein